MVMVKNQRIKETVCDGAGAELNQAAKSEQLFIRLAS
jgi:hypothetical protein